jgi:hypothetical protein
MTFFRTALCILLSSLVLLVAQEIRIGIGIHPSGKGVPTGTFDSDHFYSSNFFTGD